MQKLDVKKEWDKAAKDQTPLIELDDARPPEFSDESLAQKFARLYENELRYIAPWSRWLTWDEERWKPDDTLAAFDHARAVCRSVAADAVAEKENIKRTLTSAKTVAAVERLAKAERRIAATVDQFDSDPDSFTTTWGKP